MKFLLFTYDVNSSEGAACDFLSEFDTLSDALDTFKSCAHSCADILDSLTLKWTSIQKENDNLVYTAIDTTFEKVTEFRESPLRHGKFSGMRFIHLDITNLDVDYSMLFFQNNHTDIVTLSSQNGTRLAHIEGKTSDPTMITSIDECVLVIDGQRYPVSSPDFSLHDNIHLTTCDGKTYTLKAKATMFETFSNYWRVYLTKGRTLSALP
jgi:hypothetical protein